jgi:outer membrane immunogenic protein
MARTKFLLATALVAPIAFSATAQAADLPAPVLEPVVAPIVEPVRTDIFAGFYVGVTAGYAFGDFESDNDRFFFDDGEGRFEEHDDNGFFDEDGDDEEDNSLLAGALIGYNTQFNNFVLGVEADLVGVDISSERRRTRFERTRFDTEQNREVRDRGDLDQEVNVFGLGTVRARAGFAFDRVMVYGTGGVAFGKFDFDGRFREDRDFTSNTRTSSERSGDGEDEIETGFALGAGVETAITENVTARVEYLYYNFDEIEFNDDEDDSGFFDGSDSNEGRNRDIEFDAHTIRAAVTAKFNFGDMF